MYKYIYNNFSQLYLNVNELDMVQLFPRYQSNEEICNPIKYSVDKHQKLKVLLTNIIDISEVMGSFGLKADILS